MITYPNAKINLGLRITEKRSDGFHNLETIFYPIPLKDILEIVPSSGKGNCSFSSSGLLIDGKPEDNLCVRAYNVLHAQFNLPSVKIHLHKIIPFGAGLGGGSSDAAFTITMLNSIFGLGLNTKTMQELAAQLGSDCAFFIENQAAFAHGRGELLKPISLTMNGYYMVLLNPGIHVGTKQAYAGVHPKHPEFSLIELTTANWLANRLSIKNDFEEHIFALHPEIEYLKNELYNAGAEFALMSGSGSSVFGIFKDKPVLPQTLTKYLVFKGLL